MARVTDPDKIALLRKQEIAVEYLMMTRRDLELAVGEVDQAKTARLTHIKNARTYGLSLQAIGDALGVTEGEVRRILKADA